MICVTGGLYHKTVSESNDGLALESWSPAAHKADFTVAQDGSGSHRTIREAVDALAAMGHNRGGRRAVIHVKAGVYPEKVVIGSKMHNVMFVGDGIDRTIITGNRNVVQGSTTMNSATFGKTQKLAQISIMLGELMYSQINSGRN